MRWTCEGNPGITRSNYWTVWAIARETGQIILYIASRGHCSRGSCGLRGICGQQIVSYCDPYRLHARMVSENAEGDTAFPLPFWRVSPLFSVLVSDWVCVPHSCKYFIPRGCPRLPPLLNTERVSHLFRFLFYTRRVQTIFRPSVHRTSKSSIPVGVTCRQCIPFSHPRFIVT